MTLVEDEGGKAMGKNVGGIAKTSRQNKKKTVEDKQISNSKQRHIAMKKDSLQSEPEDVFKMPQINISNRNVSIGHSYGQNNRYEVASSSVESRMSNNNKSLNYNSVNYNKSSYRNSIEKQ